MKLSLNLLEQPFVLEAENESGSKVLIDASESIGGKNKGMRPMELLAASLASCMSIDVLLILKKQRQPVEDFNVSITARRREDVPSPFEHIDLRFSTNPEVDQEKLEAAVAKSHEKYCSVSATLSKEVKITTSFNRQEG